MRLRHRAQDLSRERRLDRTVHEHLAHRGIGHERTLVADERPADAELLCDAASRDEHAPGRDQAGDARGLGACDGRGGALRRPERLVQDGAVEIHGDRAHAARIEAGRQRQHGGRARDGAPYLPATDAT